MVCAACAKENPAAAAFCMGCGAALATVCASCGTELPAGAAFCFSCGAKVGDPISTAPEVHAPAKSDGGLRRYIPPELLTKLEYAAESGTMQGERRTVTMLFCDVKGSTAAARDLDPEEWADIMNGAFEHLIAPVYRYEGTIARLMGDAILAFFGAPIGHEDDPERAVLAGLDIVAAIEPFKAEVHRDWGIDLDVRVGINSGLVVVGAVGSDLRVEYTAMGDAVNLAARMEQTAQPGTVQVTTTTKSLVEKLFEFEDLGGIEVKGHDEPVGAFRVVGSLDRPDTIRGLEGLSAPLIGRDAELAELREAIESLASEGRGRIISVTGEAGVGKSRLVAEARRLLPEGVAWHEGRSLSYEIGNPYTPVRRAVRSLVGLSGGEPGVEVWRRIESTVAAVLPGRVADIAPFAAWLLGAEPPEELQHRTTYLQPPQLRAEAFRAIIELLEARAAQNPLVLAFEDLHWADQASLELVAELLGVVGRSQLTLVLLFRPRRDDGSWAIHETASRDQPHLYTHIGLAPLPEEDTRSLVSHLLDVDGLDEEMRRLILDKSEGNPFFVEEIIRAMIDEEAVVHDGGQWVAAGSIAVFSVPDTLSALLVTRLDRLDEQCRRVAQAASVVGRQFHYDVLAATLPDVDGLDGSLGELQKRDIVREVTRIPKRVYRFRHALVQEAAYETILLKQRVQLHGSVADFLERFHPGRDGDIADHLLKSRQTARAIPRLVAAGEEAARTYALAVAAGRMEQALAVMDPSTPSDLVRRALETLGKVREYRFDFEGAAEAYRRLRDEGEQRGDTGMQVSGMNKLSMVRGLFFAERQQALDDLSAAESMARDGDDGTGLVEACVTQCYLRTGYAEFDQVEYYMKEVSRLGEELGQMEPTLFGMAHFANTLTFLTRFDEALEAAEKLLARAEEEGNLHYQAEMLTFTIPTCHARNGDSASAMAALERGMEIAQRIGDRASEAYAATFQGKFAMAQGHLEDGLALFRRTREATDAIGVPYMRALGLCVSGTGYQSVGGSALTTALEYHDQTLDMMELPTGTTLGAWLWSEVGACALAAGRVEDAKALFAKALNEKTAPMHLMRPLALIGTIDVALVEDRVEHASAHLAELEEYVTSREMRDHYPALQQAAARVAAAAGDHAAALERLAACEETVVSEGMRRTLLDVHAAQARSLTALGRGDEADAVRARAQEVAADIASGMQDPQLRTAFLDGISASLGG